MEALKRRSDTIAARKEVSFWHGLRLVLFPFCAASSPLFQLTLITRHLCNSKDLASNLQQALTRNVRQVEQLRDVAALDFELDHEADLAMFAAHANGGELPGMLLFCSAHKPRPG